MALFFEDLADLLKLLKEHPEWRDQLRPVILGEEILQIPSRMDRVEALLEKIAIEQAETTSTLHALVDRMDAFEQRLSRMDGRLGNIEGELLEHKYARNVGSWFATWVRRPRELSSQEIEELHDAAATKKISNEDLDGVHHLDLLIRGIDRESENAEDLILAVEISYTINTEDITRASDRASVLEKAGFRTRAFVGGYRASSEVRRLAERLNVIVDLRRPPAA